MVRVLGNLFVALTLAGAALSSAIAVSPVKRDSIEVQSNLTVVLSLCDTLNTTVSALDKTKPASDDVISKFNTTVNEFNSACTQTTVAAEAAGNFTVDQANQVVDTVSTLAGVLIEIVINLSGDLITFSTTKGKQVVCSSLDSLSLSVITMVGAIANDCPASQQATLLGFVSANATFTIDVGTTAKTLGCQ